MIDKAVKINGWMSDYELRWLAHTAKSCDVIIEIGCLEGKSTRALADNTRGKVYACDLFDGSYYDPDWNLHNTYERFYKNLSDHILSGKVVPIFGTNELAIKCPLKADLMFIDGDHKYESVQQDIQTAFFHVKSGGIIAGHDYDCPKHPDVKLVVDSYFKNIQPEGSIWYVKHQ